MADLAPKPWGRSDAFHVATLFDQLESLSRLWKRVSRGDVEGVRMRDGAFITLAKTNETVRAIALRQIEAEATLKTEALARYGFTGQLRTQGPDNPAITREAPRGGDK